MEQEFKFYKDEFLNLQFIYKKKYMWILQKRIIEVHTNTNFKSPNKQVTCYSTINRSHIILLSIKIVNENYNINNCFGKKNDNYNKLKN